jgi:hypothetical protein
LKKVFETHEALSGAVLTVTEHTGDVFAAKYLHFSNRDVFPIMDTVAETTLNTIMDLTDNQGEAVIQERFGFDEENIRYRRFCRGVLSLQAAFSSEGLGLYHSRELDRYLYGSPQTPD